jgi:hypothetical protein
MKSRRLRDELSKLLATQAQIDSVYRMKELYDVADYDSIERRECHFEA